MQKTYELMLILNSTVSETDQKKAVDEIEKMIVKSGKKEKIEPLGKKVFSYPIKKQKEGFYWVLEYQYPANEITPLMAKIKLMDTIVRYLLIVKK